MKRLNRRYNKFKINKTENMKKMFSHLKPAFVLLALCLSSAAYSQNCTIVYSYDQSGNRTMRVQNCPPPPLNSQAPLAAQSETVVAPTVDGVNTIDNVRALVYPNPTYGIVNISLANFENATYQLYDISGKLVQQGQFTSGQLMLDISNEGSGQYILRILSNGQRQDYKIMKKS